MILDEEKNQVSEQPLKTEQSNSKNNEELNTDFIADSEQNDILPKDQIVKPEENIQSDKVDQDIDKDSSSEQRLQENSEPVSETEKVHEDDHQKESPIQSDTGIENSEFEHMLEESLGKIQQYQVGDKVEGEIINITDSYIFVTLGGKRDVYAEKIDYLDKDGNIEYKIGDTLSGYVVKYTDTETFIAKSLVSVSKNVLKDAYEENIPVNGKVLSTIRGGYLVNISGVRAFCPQSQIDSKIVKDIQQYIGKNFDFKIIDFQENGRNIVVSRRVLLEEEIEKQKLETLENIEVGSEVNGKVTRLTNFGAFVDLGGIEGLVHISEFSWTRIDSPSEVLNIGDDIKAKVIRLKGEKISLSMKALQTNPFDDVLGDIKEGDTVKCRVVRIFPFGAFVEIKSGVEGLIPVSELALGRRINHPSEVVAEGDMLEAQIMKINTDDKKISLSLKALQPDPWDDVDNIIKEDEIVTGRIENVVNFGAFIALQEGIVGLMPNSKIKLAGLKIDKSNVGEEFTVRIASIDKENKRISLEPTNLPESIDDGKDDWRKYRKDKPLKDDENPFNIL